MVRWRFRPAQPGSRRKFVQPSRTKTGAHTRRGSRLSARLRAAAKAVKRGRTPARGAGPKSGGLRYEPATGRGTPGGRAKSTATADPRRVCRGGPDAGAEKPSAGSVVQERAGYSSPWPIRSTASGPGRPNEYKVPAERLGKNASRGS